MVFFLKMLMVLRYRPKYLNRVSYYYQVLHLFLFFFF